MNECIEYDVPLGGWEGWTCWMYDPPPGDRKVEIWRRYHSAKVDVVTPSNLPPYWNVANVYWRNIVDRGDDK